jgi:hypothetical protein
MGDIVKKIKLCGLAFEGDVLTPVHAQRDWPEVMKLALAILVAICGTVHAAPTAEDAFNAGQAAYDAGNFVRAVEHWQESYRLSREPALLYNIGQAYRQAGDCVRALASYRQFLADDPTSDRRLLAEELVRELEPKCGRSPANALNTPQATAPSLIVQPRDEGAERSTGMFTDRRKVAIGVAALSGASLVTAVVLGTLANNKKDDAFALCPDPQTPCADAGRAHDLTVSGHRFAIGANVMFASAGAASIIAGVLWFTGAPARSRRLAVTPTSHGVVVEGRF